MTQFVNTENRNPHDAHFGPFESAENVPNVNARTVADDNAQLTADTQINFCNTGGGSYTLRMPAPSSIPAGESPILHFNKTSNDANTVSVQASTDGENINGGAGPVVILNDQLDSIAFATDGTDWWQVDQVNTEGGGGSTVVTASDRLSGATGITALDTPGDVHQTVTITLTTQSEVFINATVHLSNVGTGGSRFPTVEITRGGVQIPETHIITPIIANNETSVPVAMVAAQDLVAAGTYTYELRVYLDALPAGSFSAAGGAMTVAAYQKAGGA
jgi:hypothetical protein